MSSKSKASAPSVPNTSMRKPFLRPVAMRVASNEPTAPPAKRPVKKAASSTVTVPVSSEAVPVSPFASASFGRSVTNVSRIPLTEARVSPVMCCARSMAWAPMSPSAPDPARDLSSRQVMGASASASQSCR